MGEIIVEILKKEDGRIGKGIWFKGKREMVGNLRRGKERNYIWKKGKGN